MGLALKAAQRLKIQNRKLVVAWVSILATVMAAGTLGYQWALTESDPLVLGGESCVSYHEGKMFICPHGKKEYLVVPMPTP